MSKEHLSLIKRVSFTMQKGIFWNSKDALSEINREFILQKSSLNCYTKSRELFFFYV